VVCRKGKGAGARLGEDLEETKLVGFVEESRDSSVLERKRERR
jgi:hypothetical protein